MCQFFDGADKYPDFRLKMNGRQIEGCDDYRFSDTKVDMFSTLSDKF
jgi:hypothetical protein